MKVCRIRDEFRPELGDVGYLIYHEHANQFHIEIPSGLSFVDAPMIIDYFIEKGANFVDSLWSRRWVENRVVPRDRQNIGQVLRDAGLEFYDEYKLLLICDGRCAQDDCMVEQISESELPTDIQERLLSRIVSVTPLENNRLIVFFGNSESIIYDASYLIDDRRFKPILTNVKIFNKASVGAGGYSVSWSSDLEISETTIRDRGEPLAITLRDMKTFIERDVVDTAETAERLNCTRQNIDDLVRRGKLTPVKTTAKNKLFIRGEVEKRAW